MWRMMRLIFCTAIILSLFGGQCFAVSEKTIKLDEDWRLTGELDINAGNGNTIIIDGQGKYTIYEMLPDAVLKNTSGTVKLKDVSVISVASAPAADSLAALSYAAAAITSVAAPVKDATGFALPTAEGFTVAIESSSNTGVIALNGAVAPPAARQTVYLVFRLSGNGGEAYTKSIPVTVPAKTPSDTGDSDNSGSGGGGGGTPVQTPSPTPAIDSKGNITTAPKLDKNTGVAAAEIDIDTLAEAFEKAGKNQEGKKNVEINVPAVEDAKAYESALPASTLSSADTDTQLEIKTNIAAVTLPGSMLSQEAVEGAENVSLTIAQADVSGIDNEETRNRIGDRPVIQLNLKVDGKPYAWSNENAPVSVSIPYTPTVQELTDPEHITVWYIDGSGNVVEVPSGKYDPATGMVTFSTTHFSNFAVVYVTKTFDDLGSVAWAKKPIEVLASKGILKGTSEKEYAPQTSITRADFLYFLVRTLGVDAKVDGNFDDISSDAYYYKEIGIAKKLGITVGVGNNKFNPDASITRQDMMVLTERALRMLNRLEAQGTVSDLDKFADKSLVAAYAINGVASVVKEGLIVGSGGNVNPLGNTTRAEAAVFLYRIYNK